jgi:uncharacterized protein
MNKVKDINYIFLATVLVSILASLLIYEIPFVRDDSLVRTLVSQGVLILPTVIYLIYNKVNVIELIRFRKIKIINVILLIIFSYLISPLMSLLSAISLLFSTNMIDNTVTKIVSANPLFISVLVIAFIPCVLEETVYRGVFFNEYRKINPLKGIFLSGLLFGLVHMNFNQFIYAFAMGVIFAFIIEATDSILASMIVHFVINCNSVVITYLLPRLESYAHLVLGDEEASEMFSATVETTTETLIPVIITYAVIAAVTTTLAFLVFVLIAKNQNRLQQVKEIFKKSNQTLDTEEAEVKKKIFSIPLGLGIAICVILMLAVEI